MSSIGQYLLSITAAALIVSISNTLVGKSGFIGSIMKLISGLVLTMVIIAPWTSFRLDDMSQLYSYVEADASEVVQQGQLTAQSQISAHIKQRTQAYILDKASILGLDLTVDVKLTNDSPPSISQITIVGRAAPYAMQRLIDLVKNDLAVTEECLIWK